MHWLPWELDARAPIPQLAAPECLRCEREILSGEVVVLGGDTYCLAHGAHAAISVLDDRLTGDDLPPRAIDEACAVLRILMARARAV